MSKAMRGRPRKVKQLDQDYLTEKGGETMESEVILDALMTKEPVFTVSNERFMHVLNMLEPYKRGGLNVEADKSSITISKGAAMECFNVTTPDRYITASVLRVMGA